MEQDKLRIYLSFYREQLHKTKSVMDELEQTIAQKRQRLNVLKYKLTEVRACQPEIKQLKLLDDVALNPRGRAAAASLPSKHNPIQGFALHVLGVAYNSFKKRFESPRQPFIAHAGEEQTRIVFSDSGWQRLQRFFSPSLLRDLSTRASTSAPVYLLLHTHFNRNHTFRRYVMPPRQTHRVGLFSTRSPHRINPFGLSLVRVAALDTERRTLIVAGSDLLNGTPVFAIQLYDSKLHNHPDARAGWLDSDTLYPLYYDTFTAVGRSDREHFIAEWQLAPIPPELCSRLDFIQTTTVVDVYSMIRTHCTHKPVLSRTHKQKKTQDDDKIDSVLAISLYRVSYTADNETKLVTLTDVQPALSYATAQRTRAFDPEADRICEFHELFGSKQDN